MLEQKTFYMAQYVETKYILHGKLTKPKHILKWHKNNESCSILRQFNYPKSLLWHPILTVHVLRFVLWLYSSGSAPQVSPFHNSLEWEQWKRSCSGDRLVRHPSFPEAYIPERLRHAVCKQHKGDSSGGQSQILRHGSEKLTGFMF